jgi:hypothetical protein
VRPKKREHIRIELLVENDVVESWRVRGDLGQGVDLLRCNDMPKDS